MTRLRDSVKRLEAAGRSFSPVSASESKTARERLSSLLGTNHPYFLMLEQVGVLAFHGAYGFLRPGEVMRAIEYQRTFFDGASFGDDDDAEERKRAEQEFRNHLVPFQYAKTTGDYFCFVTHNRTGEGPLILDVYHDDCELAVGGTLADPQTETPYTRDFCQHLEWIADVLIDDADYPV